MPRIVADRATSVGVVPDLTSSIADAFAPPGEDWIRVSPKLATAYRISLGAVALLVAVALVALTFIPDYPVVVSAIGGVVLLAVVGWLWWLVGRRVRSWGYAERDDDLLVTSGIMFRRLVIVPYGRMQLVDL